MNDKREGKGIKYYEYNGKILSEVNYLNDKKEGKGFTYDNIIDEKYELNYVND